MCLTEITGKQTKTTRAARLKRENALIRGRTLYVRFPFDDDMEDFEEEEFMDILIAKRFIEECEVSAAAIVNGNGTTVATFLVDEWLYHA